MRIVIFTIIVGAIIAFFVAADNAREAWRKDSDIVPAAMLLFFLTVVGCFVWLIASGPPLPDIAAAALPLTFGRRQGDQQVRAVYLANLQAMCARASGVMCHRYRITNVGRHSVRVEYSNDDEYGRPDPMECILPAFGPDDAKMVILEPTNVIPDRWNGEGWQAFLPLFDVPALFRSGPDSDEWKTAQEWKETEDGTDA